QRLLRARQDAQARFAAQVATASADTAAQIDAQVAPLQAALRTYFTQLADTRAAFENWLADLKRAAGSHAADIPPPPAFPTIPVTLQRLLDGGGLHRIPTPAVQLTIPDIPEPDFPRLPEPPTIDLPTLTLPPAPPVPSSLAIEEVNLSGGPISVNTFDQNAPGFSVTFLMLDMLLRLSRGLLDERDWGTFSLARAMPM